MTSKNVIILSLFIMFILFSCKRNQLDVDVSKIEVELNFIDVDSEFFNKTIEETKENDLELKKKTADLYEYELSYNLRSGLDSNAAVLIYNFYSSPYISNLIKERNKKFSNLKSLENEILAGFKHFKFHFPTYNIPQEILWMNNLFSGAHSSDSSIAVGLEYYLGEENEVIKTIPTNELYEWQRALMKEKYLNRDVLESWIQTNLMKEMDGTLVEHIIQAGKVLYFVEACFPNAQKRDIIKYTETQFNYAKENNAAFWNYLIEQQLMFKNNPRDKSNMLNAGPYTVGLPDEAPDRLGQFLGWQMISSYMEKNELSLQELVEINYNTILQSYEVE